MGKRSEKIRCSPEFKKYLDIIQDADDNIMTYPQATDAIAVFMIHHGYEKIIKRMRKKR